MSLSRAARLVRVRSAKIGPSSSRRLASSSSDHHHDHHHGTSDGVEYPKEGFTGPFWRNTVLFVAVTSGIIAFAPSGVLTANSEGEAPWLTRVFASSAPKVEVWIQRNEQHLEKTEELARHNHIIQQAKRPHIHRYRYPLSFEQGSAHRVPVGGMTDLSDLVVKTNDV